MLEVVLLTSRGGGEDSSCEFMDENNTLCAGKGGIPALEFQELSAVRGLGTVTGTLLVGSMESGSTGESAPVARSSIMAEVVVVVV